MQKVAVKVPLKIVSGRAKKAAGPYLKIRNHYYLLLALVVAGYSYRWEPHLVIDRTGSLEDEGIASIAGPVTLLEYTGWQSLMKVARETGLASIHLPKWGFPAILLFVKEDLGEEELLLLDKAGLVRAKRFLQLVKNHILVREV